MVEYFVVYGENNCSECVFNTGLYECKQNANKFMIQNVDDCWRYMNINGYDTGSVFKVKLGTSIEDKIKSNAKDVKSALHSEYTRSGYIRGQSELIEKLLELNVDESIIQQALEQRR